MSLALHNNEYDNGDDDDDDNGDDDGKCSGNDRERQK